VLVRREGKRVSTRRPWPRGPSAASGWWRCCASSRWGGER